MRLPDRQSWKLVPVSTEPLYQQMKQALVVACEAADLTASRAELMRVHSNTVFLLPAERAVARITTGACAADRISTSLKVTAWLAGLGYPTVRPRLDRIFRHLDFIVSFWIFEEASELRDPSPALAGLLRELHALDDVPFELPDMQTPLAGVSRAVHEHPAAFDGEDQAWLAAEVAASEERWLQMKFTLEPGLIHGDAHPNNLLHTPRGPLLGDWDHVGRGPREWDLVQAVYFHRRFPAATDDLDAAVAAYGGFDLRSWGGVDELISIREISGLGSYIRTAGAKPRARAELAYRIRTLRDGAVMARWNSPAPS